MNALEELKHQFNDRVSFREKRPGITQLVAPFYHEDGDMLDIFIEKSPSKNKLRVCDHGMTLMRLSYSYELNTSNKERIFQKIIAENGVNEDNGNLFIDTVKGSLYVAILQFAQAIAKVSNMRHWRREVVRNLFFEDLETYVETEMASYHPQKSYQPISGDADHIVDFCFNSRPRPVYLIGVNNERTARLATITYQHLIIKKQHFVGTVVLESTDALGKRDWNRLLSAVDKTFPSLDDFREHGKEYLNRELV